MTVRPRLSRIAVTESLNFLVTNYLPRRRATRFVGWLSRVEQPFVKTVAIGIWRMFSDLDLSEAKTTQFRSLRECFIRELKDGARPIDPDPRVIVSPCDAIVGATGRIEDGMMLQVKGSTYALAELVRDDALVSRYRDGRYVTLRLTASMYHRFHAPAEGHVVHVSHIAGDAFNVNPPTLVRMDRVFCRNERAVIQMRLAQGEHMVTLVPVAAILVAGLRFNFIDLPIDRDHAACWSRPCEARFARGAEMGWFEHGSTIIVLAPAGFEACVGVEEGQRIRMGRPLLNLPEVATAS